MPHLIMDKGYQRYKIFYFTDTFYLGRSSENDVIMDPSEKTTISRKHSFIRKEKNGYILHDTSKNGTFVKNKKIRSLLLKDGIRFEIAEFGFTFVEDATPRQTRDDNAQSDNVFPDASPDFGDIDVLQEETILFQVSDQEIAQNNTLKSRLLKDGIVTQNEAMLSLYRDVEEVSQVNVPVLILGEAGTGKEKVAQAIHNYSGAKGAFVPLNCSSIPEGIFESELFGSVKGAFNDAANKPGKLEMADNGTVFFDEIGDMAFVLQPKLLRFLEDKVVTRLGDTRSKKVNVRFVAATNQDLQKMIKEGRFRGDLFQRLACVTLTIPPLRERKDDILPLAKHFLARFSKEHNLPEQIITDDGKQMLLKYHWPGNVRELSNTLLSCIIRNRGGYISSATLGLGGDDNVDAQEPTGEEFISLEEMEKRHIEIGLKKSKGNKKLASKLLGISRDTLYNKIKKFKL